MKGWGLFAVVLVCLTGVAVVLGLVATALIGDAGIVLSFLFGTAAGIAAVQIAIARDWILR